MELKRFQIILDSGEALMDEAQEIISEAKRDCDRIWDSSCNVMSEARLPTIEKSEVVIPSTSTIEAVDKDYEINEMAIQ